MGAIADLWKSERGLLAVLLVATAGVLAGLGHMTIPEWTEFTKWIFMTYTAGKTVTGAFQIAKSTNNSKPSNDADTAPQSTATSSATSASPTVSTPDGQRPT